ncbi:MAG: hypothetical protein ACK5JM_09215 [Rhodoblastus sp.]
MSEDHNGRLSGAGDGSLRARAMALVNPASGLANDFLNVYNEILMMIELLPVAPELVDEIDAWRPSSYRAYFMQSPLPGAPDAIVAYDAIDSAFRALFEASVERLAESSVAAIESVSAAIAAGAGDHSEQIVLVCTCAAARMRAQLHATEQLINNGSLASDADPQAIANKLISAA